MCNKIYSFFFFCRGKTHFADFRSNDFRAALEAGATAPGEEADVAERDGMASLCERPHRGADSFLADIPRRNQTRGSIEKKKSPELMFVVKNKSFFFFFGRRVSIMLNIYCVASVLQVMSCRPRADLYVNLPALRKLDNMLLVRHSQTTHTNTSSRLCSEPGK